MIVDMVCFASSLLDDSRTDPLITTLARYGSATSALPNSSKITASSIGPKLKPPFSSLKGTANHPRSANCFQVSGL